MSGNELKVTMVWNETPEAPPVPDLNLSEMDRTSPSAPRQKDLPLACCTMNCSCTGNPSLIFNAKSEM